MHVRSLSGIATDEKTDDLVMIKKNDDDQLMINMTQSKDNISTHQNNLHFSTGYCAQWTYLASPARSPFHHSAKNDFVVCLGECGKCYLVYNLISAFTRRENMKSALHWKSARSSRQTSHWIKWLALDTSGLTYSVEMLRGRPAMWLHHLFQIRFGSGEPGSSPRCHTIRR